MKHTLNIPKEKRELRYTNILSENAIYLQDSYYCEDCHKWFVIRRKNLMPEILTLVISLICMISVLPLGMYIGWQFASWRGSFYGLMIAIYIGALIFYLVYVGLTTLRISRAIGLETEECDETQAAQRHKEYMAIMEQMESKSKKQRKAIIIFLSFIAVMQLLGVFLVEWMIHSGRFSL